MNFNVITNEKINHTINNMGEIPPDIVQKAHYIANYLFLSTDTVIKEIKIVQDFIDLKNLHNYLYLQPQYNVLSFINLSKPLLCKFIDTADIKKIKQCYHHFPDLFYDKNIEYDIWKPFYSMDGEALLNLKTICKFLISKNVSMNKIDKRYGCSAFHQFAQKSQIDLFVYIVKNVRSLDINHQDIHGCNALYYIADHFYSDPIKSLDKINYLIEHGIEVTPTSQKGNIVEYSLNIEKHVKNQEHILSKIMQYVLLNKSIIKKDSNLNPKINKI